MSVNNVMRGQQRFQHSKFQRDYHMHQALFFEIQKL